MSLPISRKQFIDENLKKIKKLLPQGTTLVAVSKTFPFSDIEIAYKGGKGQRDFGENRVLELEEKARKARDKEMNIRWHFIGRIQSNKFRKLLGTPGLVAIHSIASLKHIQLLEKFSGEPKDPVKIFLQVKTVQKEDKSGFICKEELKEAALRVGDLGEKFPLTGLMTMGAIREKNLREAAIKCFQSLKDYRDELDSSLKLSMGMSEDYLLALAMGSECVRIGTQIFGKREDID